MKNPTRIEHNWKPPCNNALFETPTDQRYFPVGDVTKEPLVEMPYLPLLWNTLRRLIISLALFSSLTAHFAWAGLNEGRQAYEKGDYAAALMELRPLAEKGHAEAQTKLGFIYFQGLGVPQDYAEGLKWIRPAAEQGFAEAQFALGIIYVGGKAVPQNGAEAYKWFFLAAAQGSEMAKRYVNGSANNMTPDQIAKAQDAAKAWSKKHEIAVSAQTYQPPPMTVTAIAAPEESEKLRPSLEASIKTYSARQRKSSASDLRECLSLQSNEAIARCAG